MDRETWLTLFASVLRDLRPHLSARMAHGVGAQEYTADHKNPKGAAHAYHLKYGGTLPAAKH